MILPPAGLVMSAQWFDPLQPRLHGHADVWSYADLGRRHGQLLNQRVWPACCDVTQYPGALASRLRFGRPATASGGRSEPFLPATTLTSVSAISSADNLHL